MRHLFARALTDIHVWMLGWENRIIDFLTMITWWIEVRWNITNRDIGYKLTQVFYVSFFFLTFFLVPFLIEIGRWYFVPLYMLGAAVVLLALVVIRVNRVHFENCYLSGCPNPMRVVKVMHRRISLMLVGMNCFNDAPWHLLAWVFFLSALTEFIMCCDSIPPSEKARRRAAMEARNMKLVPIPSN
jgi:hypothetical protein